jgi:transcriptional regulator with XRE-family HTH domain
MSEERVLTRRGREPSILGKNIARYRKALDLSQTELGRRLDPPVIRSTVSRWEVGVTMPLRPHLLALALMFGVKVAQLFEEQPDGQGNDHEEPDEEPDAATG